jgi:hypothetical protein
MRGAWVTRIDQEVMPTVRSITPKEVVKINTNPYN